jgi:hypothetical protein
MLVFSQAYTQVSAAFLDWPLLVLGVFARHRITCYEDARLA